MYSDSLDSHLTSDTTSEVPDIQSFVRISRCLCLVECKSMKTHVMCWLLHKFMIRKLLLAVVIVIFVISVCLAL